MGAKSQGVSSKWGRGLMIVIVFKMNRELVLNDGTLEQLQLIQNSILNRSLIRIGNCLIYCDEIIYAYWEKENKVSRP